MSTRRRSSSCATADSRSVPGRCSTCRRRSRPGSCDAASSGQTSAGTMRRSTRSSTSRPDPPVGHVTSCSGSRPGAPARTSRSRGRLAAPVETYADDIENVLIKADEIEAKLAEMGEQITRDYEGRRLLLVGVLKGACVVMADLSRHIRLPLEFDFMAVSSYGAATQTSGVVRILKDLDHDLEGLDVLLVAEIIDSGLTLNYLLKNLRARKPASLEVAALLRKVDLQKVPIDIRYTGFEIPN